MNDLDPFVEQLQKLAHTFDEKSKDIISAAVQKSAQSDVESAVRSDIGDITMSGWQRNKPIPISSHTQVEGDAIVVRPGTTGAGWRKGMGPMRVLQEGRRATLFDDSGKTPKMYRMNGQKRRRVKKYSHGSTGKGTWSDAMLLLMKSTPKAAREALMNETVRNIFGR